MRLEVVLGIDPGYDRVGFAVVRRGERGREQTLYSDCLVTARTDAFEQRLTSVVEETRNIIEKFSPQAVALERLYFGVNKKTAMRVAEVRGALSYLVETSGLPLFEYTPQQIKSAVTGNGRADKRSVERMVERLTTLPPKDRLDDEYDALAVALTCLAREREIGRA